MEAYSETYFWSAESISKKDGIRANGMLSWPALAGTIVCSRD